MDSNISNILTIASGVAGFIFPALFAAQIFFQNLKVNLATWSMVLVLDFVGLVLIILAGNTMPYIQIGWCFAAILIVAAAFIRRGDWEWSRVETVSVLVCTAAVIVWVVTQSVVWSLSAYVVAVYVSVIPQGIQYWTEAREERAKTAWVWLVSAGSIALAIIGVPPGTAEPMSFYIPLGGIFFMNLMIAYLALKPTSKSVSA